MYHYRHFWIYGSGPLEFYPESQPLYSKLHFFYDYGHYGVEVFWVLSGLILSMLYSPSIKNSKINFKKFSIERLTRIYPLHIVTLVLVIYLQYIYFYSFNKYFICTNNTLIQLILHFFLASDWLFQSGCSFNGSIWSVSVEIISYIIFYFTAKYFGKKSCFYIIFVSAILIYSFKNTYSYIFNCLLFFNIGVLISYFFKNSPDLNYIFPKFLVNAICFLGLSSYGIYLMHFPIQLILVLLNHKLNLNLNFSEFWLLLLYLLSSIASGAFLYLLVESPMKQYLRLKLLFNN